MSNVLFSPLPLHERYDLKGSTRGRITSDAEKADPHVVLKDLDWIRAVRGRSFGSPHAPSRGRRPPRRPSRSIRAS